MKRFRFPLQKLLDIREHKEKLIKNELADVQIKKNIIIEKKEEYLSEDSGARKKMRVEEDSKSFTIQRLIQYQQYFRRLKASVEAQDKQIKLADDEIYLINDRLIEARKKKRVLERLKDKKIEEYNYEYQREEQDFFDEVGNNSFIQNKIKQSKIDEKTNENGIKEKSAIPMIYSEYRKTVSEQVFDDIVQELGGGELK